MGTRAELIALIEDYTDNDEESFLERIPDFIRSAEERIWYFIQVPKFRKSVTGLMTADQELLNLPDDFLAMAALFVTSPSFLPVDNKDETYIREVYPDRTATARPRAYAQQDDDTILLGPVPDQAYPVQMTYFYKPASLADEADAGTTWLSTKAFETLKFGVLLESGIYMKMQDTAVYAEYEKQFTACLTGLANLGEVRLRKDVNRGGEKRRAEA